MKKWLLFLLLIPLPSHALNLISSATWTEDGGYKMARQDTYENGVASNTISRIWDGTNIKLFGGKGELLTWVTYLNAGTVDAVNVMVKISSFTGTGAAAGFGFAAVAVSSTNAWDYSQRPYSLYHYNYLQTVGLNQVDQAWDPSEYDEQQLPPRFRVPCTINVNQQCSPSTQPTTWLWSVRADANKFYPDIAVPIEEFSISSFTVSASSSQAIGGEVYISTSLPAGTYTSLLTVTEGVSVSTTIPIQLLVYGTKLPPTASLPVVAYVGLSDLAGRINGNAFPSSYDVDPYLTTQKRTYAFLHRHKIIPIGDQPTSTANDYPSNAYSGNITGTNYKESNGLSTNTGPGYGTGDPFYMVGTYGGWISSNWSTTNVGGSTGYCTNVSSWTAFCTNNNLKCAQYTSDDEASPTLLAGRVNTFSTWNSTVTSCAFSSHTLPFLQTGDLITVQSSAPYVNTVMSTSWLGHSTSSWVAAEAAYNNGGSTSAAGGYNSGVGTGSPFTLQDDGVSNREVMWGAYKTKQPMWYFWDINYWTDSNNGGQAQNGWNANSSGQNNVYNIAKTFGYDVFPSTNAQKGHTGFSFSTDGNMIYPGIDTVYNNPSFGINGVVGSWRLNEVTRSIQDVDIINLAYAVNPSMTTSLVNNIVQDVMYLRSCFSQADCSYSYGPRPWDPVANDFETTREALLQIAASAPIVPSFSDILQGSLKMRGGIQIR